MDASQAGEGNLEILVRSHGGRGPSVPARVEPMEPPEPGGEPEEEEGDPLSGSSALFRVDFDPEHPSDHLVQVTFNDENVPGKVGVGVGG